MSEQEMKLEKLDCQKLINMLIRRAACVGVLEFRNESAKAHAARIEILLIEQELLKRLGELDSGWKMEAEDE